MNSARIAVYTAITAALAAIAACTTVSKNRQPETRAEQPLPPAEPVGGGSFSFGRARPTDSADKTVGDFRRLDGVLAAVKQGDDAAAQQFLAAQNDSAMGESVRNEWLRSLGRRGMAAQFRQEIQRLDPQGHSQEVKCYDALFGGGDRAFARSLWREPGKLPQGCNALLEQMAQARDFASPADARNRVQALVSLGQADAAARLGGLLGADGAALAEALRGAVSPAAVKNDAAAAAALDALQNGSLNGTDLSFSWGVLGLSAAKKQNMAAALAYFGRAPQPQHMSNEQLEWYARAALRLNQWPRVAQAVDAMPDSLKNDPAWLYWRGRSFAAQGNREAAAALYRRAAQSGRNFYAILAAEELGGGANARSNVGAAPKQQTEALAKDGALHRALSLFHTSQQEGSWKMRRQAQAEWRYATRHMNEGTMLAAAQLAFDHQFYEMAIYSADKTAHQLNFNLRYPTPFRDLVTRYAAQAGVDPAWVYGLIRQESRFVMGAQSGVGARGLMQVMPGTARDIARKTGMSEADLHTTEGNIRMGTWYMADACSRLQNNEVLATAGYNAGPGRARNWQAGAPLEGAVYAETIPFDETRDYVKKVMANSVYYAHLLGEPHTSLKRRMGTVPGR